MTPIAIFHVGEFDKASPNGVNRTIYNYGRLLEREYAVHVITFDLRHQEYRRERDGAITIHHFSVPSIKGFSLPHRFVIWFKQLSGVCIFHLHSVFYPVNYSISRLCDKYFIPYIFTPHDSYSFNSLETKKLAKRVYLRLFERKVIRGAHLVQALTERGKADIAQFCQKEKLTLVPHFIPSPNRSALSLSDRKGLVYVGRLDIYQKGLDLLLITLGIVKRCNTAGSPVHLNLLGPGSIQDIKRLRRTLIENGLRENEDVMLCGFVDESQKRAILTSAKFYVQLSRFEGFGLSIVEAMAEGVPVIISKEVPIADVVSDYGGGYVVADTTQAAEKIIDAMALNKRRYEQMVKATKLAFQQRFSVRAGSTRVLEMYRRIIRDREDGLWVDR